ncbi:unnamed protein product [Calypogeia fissa]
MQAPVLPKPRLDFFNTRPPANYVAGLGRGATGFTTRSDIGPARAAPDLPDRAATTIGGAGPPPTGEYDEDDKEADAVWESIDKRMDLRRKDRREARLKKEIEKYRASNPKITEQFADLKRKLVTLSAQEWESIPEIGDYSLRNKKKRFESFIPVPDTLLERAKQEQEHVTALDPRCRAANGAETPHGQTPVTDLTAVGEARGTVLSLKLDHLSDSIGAARDFIQKGFDECPKNEDVWLEACRLATPDNAKGVLARGVKAIPNSVKLWMQAARLEHDDIAKSRVLRKALEHIPDSVRLWKAVVELANDDDARVLLSRAVECCPLHTELWLALARLETYENAKRVLNKARETIPTEPSIWITAAKLEEAHGNQTVLRIVEKAIKSLQAQGVVIDREAWMKEAEAAERAGSVATCRAIIRSTVGIGVEEEDRKRTWVADADETRKRGDVPSARVILKEANVAIPNSEEIWLAAFKLEFENHEPERARMLLGKARERGGTERVWMKSAIVERELGNTQEEKVLLEEGLQRFPGFHKLWLMLGQLEDRLGNSEAARDVYEKALKHCSNSTPLWLCAASLEEKMGGLSKARAVLTKARLKNSQNPELWLAAIRAEARAGNKKESEVLMAKALQECPSSGRLWAESIEMAPRQQRKTRSVDALKKCDHDPFVIAAVAKLFWHDRNVDKARNWLNRAVTLAPDVGDFWAQLYKFELQHGAEEQQHEVLQRCAAAEPRHGERWTKVSKAVENAHQPVEALLKKVVIALGKEEGVVGG